MQLKNAIKKLEHNGWKAEGEPGKPFWNYGKGQCLIQLGCNPPHEDGTRTVVMIDARRRTDKDEIESDYHAGTFCETLPEAFRLCERIKTW
jgi:hypothetical protein